MVNYKVTIYTGNLATAGTFNNVSIKLVGTHGESKRTRLKGSFAFFRGAVEVKSPKCDTYNFPIYHWITDSEVHRFREATALRVFEDNHPLGRYSREQELEQRKEDYRWDVYLEGIPHCMKAENPQSLPNEVRFSFTKTTEFLFTLSTE
ncbi:Hydroperoxide isomerase ALOXE3 [Liparis tanakae]|uniref:Hydroperoxide isomerase ALOXE3 n=1 Tax=Liparis tanakae TaxID=230148 RepID=A0A4Z2EAB6_9TELE|nr:Hydroperoxide isomerase ALOXE3 [Liparis tanakae]